MRTRIPTLLVVAIAISTLAGCAQATVDAAPKPPAAVSEPIPGSDLLRITLTEGAVARLAIETTRVTEDLAIPYGALLYDAQGEAWAYTNPEPLVYVRAAIEVDRIDGDRVLLTDGPTPGTAVVSVGAAELYGVESGVGGGH
jgi:hypothetical protein